MGKHIQEDGNGDVILIGNLEAVDIVPSGTVDGRDVATDGTKLDDTYTKSETDAQIAAVVDSAPATLDTLNELAAALGDDENFATTTANSIATKVSKTGDTMTGDLIVPTIKIGTATALPNTTADHKLQVDGYVKHKYGWKDNIQPFSSAKGNGTTEPVWKNIGNGNYAMHFTAGDELFVMYHVNHDYALGTDAYPHIHFFCKDVEAAGVTVTWRFSYRIGIGHQQAGSLTGGRTNVNMTYTYTGAEVAGEHIILESSDAQAFDLIEPDTIIMAGVELLSTTAVGRVFGLMADLHYQSDGEVTVSKSPDFNVAV